MVLINISQFILCVVLVVKESREWYFCGGVPNFSQLNLKKRDRLKSCTLKFGTLKSGTFQ